MPKYLRTAAKICVDFDRRYDRRPQIRVENQELIGDFAHTRNILNQDLQRLALFVSRYSAAQRNDPILHTYGNIVPWIPRLRRQIPLDTLQNTRIGCGARKRIADY